MQAGTAQGGSGWNGGAAPHGFYLHGVGNAEAVILGTRPFTQGEHGLTLPHYCPSPIVARVQITPMPNAQPDWHNGIPSFTIPFAWGYPHPHAGAHITVVVYARIASGASSLTTYGGSLIDGTWRQLVEYYDGNSYYRAIWRPHYIGNLPGPIEMEYLLPHLYLGRIPRSSVPVYARAVQHV